MSLINEFTAKLGTADALRACQFAIRKHFPSAAVTPNANLTYVAKGKGIRVIRNNNLPYEGMIERDGYGKATITIRNGRSNRRQRFTMAHELGHWVLQEELIGTMDGKLFRGVSRNVKEMRDEERLASLLAAELLMPFDLIRNRFDHAEKVLSLNGICREFGVSRTAALRRIADVTDTNLLLLQLVPYKFDDLNSRAEVDDAVFATAQSGTLIDRERTRLLSAIRYCELLAQHDCELELETPKGRINGEFEIDSRPSPIPHAFAVAFVSHWSM